MRLAVVVKIAANKSSRFLQGSLHADAILVQKGLSHLTPFLRLVDEISELYDQSRHPLGSRECAAEVALPHGNCVLVRQTIASRQ